MPIVPTPHEERCKPIARASTRLVKVDWPFFRRTNTSVCPVRSMLSNQNLALSWRDSLKFWKQARRECICRGNDAPSENNPFVGYDFMLARISRNDFCGGYVRIELDTQSNARCNSPQTYLTG